MRIIIFIILLVLFTFLLQCRQVTVVNSYDDLIYAVCDTISIKTHNGIITCTVRCTDQYGVETVYFIPNCGGE